MPPDFVDRAVLVELLLKARRGYVSTELDVVRR